MNWERKSTHCIVKEFNLDGKYTPCFKILLNTNMYVAQVAVVFLPHPVVAVTEAAASRGMLSNIKLTLNVLLF